MAQLLQIGGGLAAALFLPAPGPAQHLQHFIEGGSKQRANMLEFQLLASIVLFY